MIVTPTNSSGRQPVGSAAVRRRGYTLAELLAAMAIMTVIVGAASGSLMIASRALDSNRGDTAKTLRARDVTDGMLADLRMATGFTEQTSNGVTFTVADRDGDNKPETIRYAWSSETEILSRGYNDAAPVTLAENVKALDFTYLNRTVTPPPQACCDGPGNCTMQPPDLCSAGGGTPKGKNLTCADNPCGGACCLGDGTCVETLESDCESVQGGTYQGDGSLCIDVNCPQPLDVLLVIDDPADLTSHDEDRIALFESWNYSVTLFESDQGPANFDVAAAGVDVVYILPSADANDMADGFNHTGKGVVSELRDMAEWLRVWNDTWNTVDATAILVDDNTHYITSPFASGTLTILTEEEKLFKSNNDPAPGTMLLASPISDTARTALAVIETGHLLADDSRAAGRRALLPWGDSLPSTSFNDDGFELMKRAMQWAAGEGTSQPKLLFVVTDAGSPTTQEADRQVLFESWGYAVELLTSSSSQAAYDAAGATAVVAYLSEDLNSSDVDTKLTAASLGIVNEEVQLSDELGISSDRLFKLRASLEIVDNAHYLTSSFAMGPLVIFDSIQPVHMLKSSLAPDLLTLGEMHNTGSIYEPALAVLETGDALEGGGTAAGRRVELPWGGNDLDINTLTADGETIMRRAVDWAAGRN